MLTFRSTIPALSARARRPWPWSFPYHLSRALLLAFFMLGLAGARLAAQNRLAPFGLDDTAYPIISARLYAVDASGTAIQELDKDDFLVIENGRQREVLSISCPPPSPPAALSSVLMIDVSGSMSGGSGPNMEVARAAARAWVNALPLGASECAVASFDHDNYLNQDFTTDRARLLTAIDGLRPNGGTDYNAAFIDPPSGAIQIASRGHSKRVVMFLTDGTGEGTEDDIVRMAQDESVVIYCVTVGMLAPALVRNVAERTGGACFENIRSREEAEAVYRTILGIAQGVIKPCTIQWRSSALCELTRDVTISIPAHGVQGTIQGTISRDLIPTIEYNPAFTSFGGVPPGTVRDTIITITARNLPVRISSITVDDPRFTVVAGGAPPDKVLQPGESISVQVRFAPVDSGYALGMLVVESDACSSLDAFISGGYPEKPPTRTTLRVMMPNRGEELAVGADTVIRWTGLPPESTVRLEYSVDEGSAWNVIAPAATGLSHRWTVPPTPSRRCLLRATQIMEAEKVITLEGHTAPLSDAGFSPDGLWAVTGSGDSTVRIWNAQTGELVRIIQPDRRIHPTRPNVIRSTEFSPDGSLILVASENNFPELFDWRTGTKVRFFTTFSILQGMGVARFTPDGSKVVFSALNGRLEMNAIFNGTNVFTQQPHNGPIVSINFSPDGRYLATGGGYERTIKILDMVTGAVVRTITSPTNDYARGAVWNADGSQLAVIFEDVAIYDFPGLTSRRLIRSSVEAASFSPNGLYLVTGNQQGPDGGTLTVFEAATGIPLRTYVHNARGGVYPVRFSPDGRRIISAGVENVAKIWEFEPVAIQQDVSDSLWAIVRPIAVAADLDMGDIAIGTQKDSLITAYICNGGDGIMSVTDIDIQGAQAGEFSIVSGDAPFVLGAGECRAVEFRFRPSQAGPRSAEVVITTTSEQLRRGIRGVGVEAQLDLAVRIIDFGGVRIGDAKDTIVQIVIRNTGSGPATVDATKLLGPDTDQFSIVDGGGAFTLAAGEARRMTLRFMARRLGRTSGRLAFEFSRAGSPLVVLLFAEGLCPASGSGASHRLQLGDRDMEVNAGDTLLIPVFLRDVVNFPGVSGEYRMSVRVNRRLLFPLDSFSLHGADAFSTAAGDALIHYNGSWNGAGDTLLRLGFLAALGDAEETEVEIESFGWGFECPIEVTLSTHVVRVRVCREGESPRLFIDNGENLGLKPLRPNPSSSIAKLDIVTGIAGPVRIDLIDALGRRAGTLFDGNLGVGEHSLVLDLASFPSGRYLYVVETGFARRTGVLEILR